MHDEPIYDPPRLTAAETAARMHVILAVRSAMQRLSDFQNVKLWILLGFSNIEIEITSFGNKVMHTCYISCIIIIIDLYIFILENDHSMRRGANIIKKKQPKADTLIKCATIRNIAWRPVRVLQCGEAGQMRFNATPRSKLKMGPACTIHILASIGSKAVRAFWMM